MVGPRPRYRKLNPFLRGVFGEKVSRVGVYGGFTCPNRDGTRGRGGCIFCNPASSEPLNYRAGMSLGEQLAVGTEYIRRRHRSRRFIPFFQDYTATYEDCAKLEALYREAMAFPGVVGLAVGTRPDCLPEEVLDLLGRIARETFLWVELGIQSAHQRSLRFLNRCHSVQEVRSAAAGLHARHIAISGHVILGLPGESLQDMLATARFLAEIGVHGVKVHNLHVVENTPLAGMLRRGRYTPLRREEYLDFTVAFLEALPPGVIVQRTSGEAPRRLTVAPAWSVNKLAVVNAVERELARRNTWQGRAVGAAIDDLRAPVRIPGATAS